MDVSFLSCVTALRALHAQFAYVATLFLPGPAWIYAFFSVMITCMYLSTPGKWVQPIFATASGVSMASIVIGSTAAVEYRLLYLGLAALLVFLVNRFIFPSSLNIFLHFVGSQHIFHYVCTRKLNQI